MPDSPKKQQGEIAPMAVRGSWVIQTMLKRLAEEEERSQQQKAEGTVGTAKPLEARAAEA
jgi:hypothetical protein